MNDAPATSISEPARAQHDGVAPSAEVVTCARVALHGRRGFTPRGPLSTLVLVLSGALPVWRVAGFVAGSVLGVRRPMVLEFSSAGVTVSERLEWSGRLLGETKRWIPRDNLARVSREQSYSRLGLYTGMLALVTGTYFGARRLFDGLAVFGGSPILSGSGLLIVLSGVALDYALWRGSDAVRRRCQVVVVPRQGRAFSCAGLDRQGADEALRALGASD